MVSISALVLRVSLSLHRSYWLAQKVSELRDLLIACLNLLHPYFHNERNSPRKPTAEPVVNVIDVCKCIADFTDGSGR